MCQGQTTLNSSKTIRHHNKIDEITNIKQIQSLIKSIDKEYSNFKIDDTLIYSDKDCKRLCDSLKIKTFTKADLDNNGYTDLIVIGEWNDPSIICIFDQGKNKFSINRLTRRSFQDCSFASVDTNGGETFVNYYYFKQSDDWRQIDTTPNIQSKKLIYKFGDFVEYNNSPPNYNIQKLEFQTTMCFGSCPIFNLTINSNRSAKYEAVKFNESEGEFSGTIDKDTYNELLELLNYIDFPNLKNNYSVGWTDDQTCTLSITYDNGKKKTITDYGKIGTYGLDRIYSILFKLRENQTWN